MYLVFILMAVRVGFMAFPRVTPTLQEMFRCNVMLYIQKGFSVLEKKLPKLQGHLVSLCKRPKTCSSKEC